MFHPSGRAPADPPSEPGGGAAVLSEDYFMSKPVDLEAIFFRDGEPTDERLVQNYVQQIRQTAKLTKPILVRKPDGRYSPLDEDARAKVEALRRCDVDDVRAYVIDDPNDPEKLQRLRQRLKAERLRSN
jgi:hypothetical protein